jgi:proteasome lid subunit RPN8/RPN11
MKLLNTSKVHIVLPKAALLEIFDECDRFNQDETGGRIIGTFKEHWGKLTLHITGIIEPGPKARRSPVMLFQDGDYQEDVFRRVEAQHRDIEHLGTWHTHHVNGLQTLSDGDITTYSKTVNHPNQNTPFFYALLVVAKHESEDPLERYSFKHFIFRRGDDDFYEIPSRQVEIVDTPLVWPLVHRVAHHGHHAVRPAEPKRVGNVSAQPERVYDRDILSEFYKGVRPFTSPKLGFYWRGTVELLDGSEVQVVLLEDSSSNVPSYSLVIRDAPQHLAEIAEKLSKQDFSSARVALMTAERLCNRFLYKRQSLKHKSGEN